MVKLRFGNRRCPLPTSSVGASPSAPRAAMVFLSTLVAPATWGQSTGSPAEPASDNGKVPEIVVTAQRRSESLQNTPVAVTAITGDALAAQHIDDIWSAEAWCLNCADRRYYIVTFPVPLQTGTQGAYVGAPRTFGLTLRAHF
jgi:outer membrane receptor protein involved in Fe transport